jgi:hypothetical protein
MTIADWIRNYAAEVEEYLPSWQTFYDRTKFNRLDNGEQDKYMRDLKEKASRPQYRAWARGRETFYPITKMSYDLAIRQGIPARIKV